jgi:dihydrofolate synthase/folylpolyglutamate synthase
VPASAGMTQKNMSETSSQILARLHTYHSLPIDLSLRDGYFRLLERLGNPHLELPPVIHVAGTNGKGSTLAFLRAMLEADGKTVHVYTSPHLVRFHERIRIAGQLIEEKLLVELLKECEDANAAGQVTFFELTTALAFLAFSRTPADFTLLETGMGGRLDATNVVTHPALSIITRISRDHSEFLGQNLKEIAGEKAGIFKKNTVAVIAPQDSEEVIKTLEEKAQAAETPLFQHDKNWRYALTGNGFSFLSSAFTESFPEPSLRGEHQYANAATAIAALMQLPQRIYPSSMQRGLRTVEWPARLQKLTQGPLVEKLPEGTELWLDGGHNDSAGLALARMAQAWCEEEEKPLFLIYGMLSSKQPEAFLAPLAPHTKALAAIAIPEEPKTLGAAAAAQAAIRAGIFQAHAAPNLTEALDFCLKQGENFPSRILICGSLYLAGYVLRDHG